MPGEPVTTRPLTRADWPVIEALFGANGACGGCWCMWWRVPMGGKAWDAAKGSPNREACRSLVQSGRASGVLAFDGDRPVGWCAVGPRADFPRLEHSKALARPGSDTTWSINCLYVPARERGRGVATALVDAAVALALERGASEIEAYPQVVQPGQRQAGAFVWTGVPALYERAGFTTPLPRDKGRVLYLLPAPASD